MMTVKSKTAGPGDPTVVGETALRDLASAIRTDGFVLLSGLCTRALLRQLLNVAHRRIDEVRSALGDRSIGIGSAAGFLEIVQRSPGRWDLPISPERFGVRDHDLPWWPLIRTVLGEAAEHSFSGIVFSESGSPAQCWHIDSPHLAAEHRPAHALNVLVALHDIPVEMGPTEMACGSQVLTNHLRNPDLVSDDLVYQHSHTSPQLLTRALQQAPPEARAAPLRAGSCLVFDDRILHRGLANRSESARYVAYFSYRKSGYAENTHFESQRSIFDATD